MTSLRTPGVYIREVEVKPPPRLRMDIAGFVGQAERGPLNQPQPLTSWGEYRDVFGDFIGHGYLPYCVFTFFADAGEKCYVVRVAHEKAAKAWLALNSSRKDGNGNPIPLIRVEAINEGAWGNGIEVVAESVSSDDLILTRLDRESDAGSRLAYFQSVAGLLEGDPVTLIHPSNPARQQRMVIKEIIFAEKTVVFETSVGDEFPAGSRVLGKGFKLTFRHIRDGRFIRGEVFDNLSLSPSHERYFVRVINGDPEEPDYIKRLRAGYSILVRVTDLCVGDGPACARIAERPAINLSRGDDAERADDGKRRLVEARYFTGYDPNGEYFRPPLPSGADQEAIRRQQEKLFGLATFEAVEEIGGVAIPDLIVPDLYGHIPEKQIPEEGIIFAAVSKAPPKLENLKTGQTGMLFHCRKMGERFAILDSPRAAEIGRGENKIEEWPNNYQLLPSARYGALYYPWIRQKAEDFEGRELLIPPCGHLAGIYSRTEQERGVGKSPANEIVRGAVDLEFCLSDAEQAILNPRGVNCLRGFPGRGLRVWGARTLSPDPMSLYVNIRRVALAIIKNILVNLRWTVFEPNDPRLWNKITATLKLFLNGLFKSGALAGARPEEAFFVKCDEETNPPEIVDLGQVITEIGFAPARPAEFILVTIKRSPGALSVIER